MSDGIREKCYNSLQRQCTILWVAMRRDTEKPGSAVSLPGPWVPGGSCPPERRSFTLPATYAHFSMGRETARRLEPAALGVITQAPQLYSIGLHGPDLFFYYKPLSKNPVNQLGHGLHDRPGREFFERAARVLKAHPDSVAHRAYVYGFLCHFVLDTLSHDYVAEAMAATGLSHTRIETELERTLMLQDGLEPVSHHTTGHLVPSEENAVVIADFFPELTVEQVLDSLRGMIFYLDLLVAPSALKRWAIFTALRLAGQYENLSGLVMVPEPEPRCEPSNAELLRRLEQAAEQAARLIAGFDRVEASGRAEEPLYGRTFDPRPEQGEPA